MDVSRYWGRKFLCSDRNQEDAAGDVPWRSKFHSLTLAPVWVVDCSYWLSTGIQGASGGLDVGPTVSRPELPQPFPNIFPKRWPLNPRLDPLHCRTGMSLVGGIIRRPARLTYTGRSHSPRLNCSSTSPIGSGQLPVDRRPKFKQYFNTLERYFSIHNSWF
jgi:hypothetical protein